MLKKYIISEISTLSKTKNDLSSFTNANFLHKVGAAGTIILKCEVYQKISLFKFKA